MNIFLETTEEFPVLGAGEARNKGRRHRETETEDQFTASADPCSGVTVPAKSPTRRRRKE